jgi:hypothetical protein
MNNQAARFFASSLEARMDYECPATQSAIDSLVAFEGFRGRRGMVEVLCGQNYDDLDFNSSLLSAWNDKDVLLATGRSRKWWLNLAESMGKRIGEMTLSEVRSIYNEDDCV